MLRREVSARAQEWGKDTHKRTRTRVRRSGSRLRARGEQEAPTHQDSHDATSAAQRGSTATDQDAFQPPVSTPPRQTREGEGEGGGGVEEWLARSHRGLCIPSPSECQAYCSHRDLRIRCRDWPS